MLERTGDRVRPRRWAALAAAGTAAHHGFELFSGIGLVGQPDLGLRGAGALWAAQLPGWVLLALRGGRRWDPLLASWSGAALGGVAVHFVLWPHRRGPLGLPVLTEAEGLRPGVLPAYNALLYAWGAACAIAVVRDVPAGRRRWAAAGMATLPLLERSAARHFRWVEAQAVENPAWWNRGVRDGHGVDPSGEAASVVHRQRCASILW